MNKLAEDAQALLSATADVAGEKVGEARKRLAAAVERGREVYGRVREQAIEGAKVTDEVVWSILIKRSGSASESGRSSAICWRHGVVARTTEPEWVRVSVRGGCIFPSVERSLSKGD